MFAADGRGMRRCGRWVVVRPGPVGPREGHPGTYEGSPRLRRPLYLNAPRYTDKLPIMTTNGQGWRGIAFSVQRWNG